MYACMKLKISVSAEPIGFYSLVIIPIGSVVVLRYFLVGWDTSNPPPPQKIDCLYFFKSKILKITPPSPYVPIEASRGVTASSIK